MLPLIVAGSVVGVLALVLGVLATNVYNQLVSLKNLCDNGFSQIEVQLKRRYDLIPNLVECVQGYLKHERETLEKVIKARNYAASQLAEASQNPNDVNQIKSFGQAEGALTGALGRLNFVMESYPDLKASENVAMLTEELTSTENKIAFARQAFNDWVMAFNTYRESFPGIAFAGTLGFPESRPMLDFDDAEVNSVPKVSLSTAAAT